VARRRASECRRIWLSVKRDFRMGISQAAGDEILNLETV
jgi:hypothetical protein